MEGTRNALDPTRNDQSYAQDSTPEVCGTDWSCRNVKHACYQRRSERQQFWSNREYLPDRASGRDAEKCKGQAPRAGCYGKDTSNEDRPVRRRQWKRNGRLGSAESVPADTRQRE